MDITRGGNKGPDGLGAALVGVFHTVGAGVETTTGTVGVGTQSGALDGVGLNVGFSMLGVGTDVGRTVEIGIAVGVGSVDTGAVGRV